MGFSELHIQIAPLTKIVLLKVFGRLSSKTIVLFVSHGDQGSLKKIMPSANTWCVPVPLHSSQSAMALLHSNHQAYLIT